MQDLRRPGWFRLEHATLPLLAEHFPPRQRPYAIAAYTVLAKLDNDHRNATAFEASNEEIAALAGMSKDTFERLIPTFINLGLLERKKGARGGKNTWTVTGVPGRSERPGFPPRAARAAATGGSTRARPLPREEVEEEKKDAPVGAGSPPDAVDPAMDRASAIVAAHSKLVAAHIKRSPRAPTVQDREAAVDLARRLDGDDWQARIDLALREGLAGSRFMRGKVLTVAGLAEYLDELIERAEGSDTGPPPAAWDEPDDDRPWWVDYSQNLSGEFERVFARLPADCDKWTRNDALDWAVDRGYEDHRLAAYEDEFWEALQRRLGLAAAVS